MCVCVCVRAGLASVGLFCKSLFTYISLFLTCVLYFSYWKEDDVAPEKKDGDKKE